MRRVGYMGVALLLVVGCALPVTRDEDLLDAAVDEALEKVLASLKQAPKTAGITRIGLAYLDGDIYNLTKRLQIAATKTRFDIVLTDDAECGPLLDEFSRQVRRADLIDPDTAHELRVHGVDAVLFGTIDRYDVVDVQENLFKGRQATVRMLLEMGSVVENAPFHVIWGEDVSASVDNLAEGDRAFAHLRRQWIIVAAVVGLIFLLLAVGVIRRMRRPY